MNKINIAVFGLGVVGGSLIKIIENNKYIIKDSKINIVGIKANNKNKKRIINTKKYNWIDNLSSLKDLKIDIIIEAVGGTDKFVNSLYQYAIKNISDTILPKKIKSIYGIFNGTTNYILSHMYKNKISFKDSLNLAIKNGFAEQNSSSDLSGKDAAHKLTLLSNLSFQQKFQFKDISYSGIENIKLIDLDYGLQLGYKLKLLSISEKIGSKFYSSVAPCFVKKDSVMANTEFEDNLCILEGDDFVKTSLIGKGAGGFPTATSIISDLATYIITNDYKVFNSNYSSMPLPSYVNQNARNRSYFIRLSVANKVGVLKTITQFFAKKSISIKSIIQLNPDDSNTVPIVIISNVVSQKKIIEITKLLKKNSYIKNDISTIRLEDNSG